MKVRHTSVHVIDETMKAKLMFAWYDFWVGLFWDSKKRMLYFFPIPMFGIVLKFEPRKKKCEHDWERSNYRDGKYTYHCKNCHEEMYV